MVQDLWEEVKGDYDDEVLEEQANGHGPFTFQVQKCPKTESDADDMQRRWERDNKGWGGDKTEYLDLESVGCALDLLKLKKNSEIFDI